MEKNIFKEHIFKIRRFLKQKIEIFGPHKTTFFFLNEVEF